MEEILLKLQGGFFEASRIGDLIIALGLTLGIGVLSGPFAGNINPFIWQVYNILFGGLGERMDKPKRKPADLIFRGFVLTVLCVLFAVLLGFGALIVTGLEPFYGLSRILLLCALLSGGALWFNLVRLYKAIESGKVVKGAFYALARSARVNLTAGDDFGINRCAIGLSVMTFDKGLIAPAFWYWLGGFPAAFAYSALAMLVWRFGRKGTSHGFAAVPIALERIMGYVPSLISALFLNLATIFTPTAKIHKGLASWLGSKSRASYEQGGAPLSVLAWSLNISIGGPVQDISGNKIKADWVGPEKASAKVGHKHLRRALYINVVAHILVMAVLVALYMGADVLRVGERYFTFLT